MGLEANMDRESAKKFLDRWEAIEEVRLREARTATLELRWRQLNAVYRLSRSLKLVSDQPDETRGYERWARLKEKASRGTKA
jgi:hypothetical protein